MDMDFKIPFVIQGFCCILNCFSDIACKGPFFLLVCLSISINVGKCSVTDAIKLTLMTSFSMEL